MPKGVRDQTEKATELSNVLHEAMVEITGYVPGQPVYTNLILKEVVDVVNVGPEESFPIGETTVEDEWVSEKIY